MTGETTRRRPRVFSIPAGAPFLETLADSLLSGVLFGRDRPLTSEELADATLFLPTRRAAQAFAALIAGRSAPGAALLPRIVLLGDPEPDSAPGVGLAQAAGDDLPPAIGPLPRRLKLFDLVDAWRRAIEDGQRPHAGAEPFYVARSRADAFALAGDLARLIDETHIEDVPLERLAQGVPAAFDPARHDAYWSLTAKFLEIAAARWPAMLADIGLCDAEQRNRQLLLRHADALARSADPRPVVVAGSTGSVAATAELMRAVAGLPSGAVVLPGLDTSLEAEAWSSIGADSSELATRFAHPQSTMKRTLARIGIDRTQVAPLGHARIPDRPKLVSEVFRPTESCEAWHANAGKSSTEGLALIEASDLGEEALAIALVLREALETPGRTVALTTPDRLLARAVQCELQRWGVRVADSAGRSLSETPVGVLAGLLLAAARPDAGGAELLTLLRHPLVSVTPDAAAAVDAIELVALRGARWQGRLAALAQALRDAAAAPPGRHDGLPRRRVPASALDGAIALAERAISAVAHMQASLTGDDASLMAAARAHRDGLTRLVGRDAADLPAEFEPLLALFEDIEAAGAGPDLTFDDYRLIFDDLAGAVVLAPTEASHPQVRIWGLLEARLLDADRIVLGGLNEGVWPADPRGDPFLNRPMRLALGLSPPERRIGQSAHDFQILLGHPDVILSRAKKREGAPAVASRFWRRLHACIGAPAADALHARGQRYLDWARRLDQPAAIRPVIQPAPRITADLMPTRLALTEVETLYRDPYAVFARRVLRLDPLEAIEPPFSGRESGTLMHEILAQFARDQEGTRPDDAVAALLKAGRDAFALLQARDPAIAYFWWRRFEAFAPWFVRWDETRRPTVRRLHVEQPGSLAITLAQGALLTITTRADRIEEGTERLAIVDFKTGAPPSGPQVIRGLAPQLPLTAALLQQGAFPGVPKLPVGELAYLRVAQTGGGGAFSPIKIDPGGVAALAKAQFDALERMLRELSAGTRPFLSRRMPERLTYAGDFDLLARHLEWSLGGTEDTDRETEE